MTSSPTKIDPFVQEEIEAFYAIAKEIRARNDAFELPWIESPNIVDFLAENEINSQLFLLQGESGSGRVMAFQFADSPEKGYLGWYECDDEDSVSSLLLKKSEEWLKSQGVSTIHGPMNGSSWGSFRFNTDAAAPLFATEPYQPLYYPEQWKKSGFEDDVMYQTNLVPKEISRPMSLLKVKALATLIGAKFNTWPHNLAADEDSLRDMHNFFHTSFKDNPLYRPVSFETYKKISAKLEKIIDFEHSFLVTDKKRKPVSVLISYRDVYNDLYQKGELKNESHNTKTLYMKTICTAPAWRGKHISRVLVNYGFNVAFKNDYKEVVFGTMMVNNNSAKYSRSFFKAKPLRTYSFMTKKI